MNNNITVDNRLFSVSAKEFSLNFNIYQIKSSDNYQVFRCSVDKSSDFHISFEIPMLGDLSSFAPTIPFNRNRMLKQWFAPRVSKSEFFCGIPMFSLVNNGDFNYLTVALSNAVIKSEISVCVNDFVSYDKIKVDFFFPFIPNDNFSFDFLVDMRSIPFANAIKDLGNFFKTYYPSLFPTPKLAFEPVYSTWYNFHQHPNQSALLPELVSASNLGFKTVIIDDGWQFDGNGTGDYSNCGDWLVSSEKFPDFKGFIDNVHNLFMKVMLWFPVPFVGFNTSAYSKFKDKLLYEEKGNINAGILDPRYKSVRSFIVENFCSFVKKFDLDGLKLDFIDSFMLKDDSPSPNPSMDESDLSRAIILLLNEINFELKKINPDFLIEFRQDYVGPAIVSYCNMLRIGDCAFDSVTNRIAISDLQMFNYDSAIHSDMLLWSPSENNVYVAKQLLNVLFSVPQISILLNDYPLDHINILKNFINYYSDNKDILNSNDISVFGTDKTYSLIEKKGVNKIIAALYSNSPYILLGNTDLFNASNSELVIISNNLHKNFVANIVDFFGNTISSLELSSGLNSITVPLGGLLLIRCVI